MTNKVSVEYWQGYYLVVNGNSFMYDNHVVLKGFQGMDVKKGSSVLPF